MTIPKQIHTTYWRDPGHGWFQVPKRLIQDLGLEDKISSYSYQDQHDVYLEEDCDFGLLYTACKNRGVKLEWQERYEDRSHIRNLDHYTVKETA